MDSPLSRPPRGKIRGASVLRTDVGHDRAGGAVQRRAAYHRRCHPLAPRKICLFIPEPAGDRKAPQTNDVALDDRGLIYLCDRNLAFDIVELKNDL